MVPFPDSVRRVSVRTELPAGELSGWTHPVAVLCKNHLKRVNNGVKRIWVICLTSNLFVVLLQASVSPAIPLPDSNADGTVSHRPLVVMPARHVTVAASAEKPPDFVISPQIEIYGNFHTIGLIATLPNEITAADVKSMHSYINVRGQWRPQHDLVQVGEFPWFATSVFWLQPGCSFQFKVEVVGIENDVIAVWYGEGATRADPILHQSSSRIYVAVNGDDNNPGTKERPFRTVAKGFSTVTAGQTLEIREGRYHEGQLMLAHDGRPDAPIVIRAYPGEHVILDGTDPALADLTNWDSDGAGAFSTACEDTYRSATVIRETDGKAIRFFPVRELQHLKQRAIPEIGSLKELGIEGAVFCDGNRIHISSQMSLLGQHLHVSGCQRGIVLENRQHVQIDSLNLVHYGRDESTCAVYVLNSSDVLIQNCRFCYDDSHIYVKRNSHRLTIQNCVFKDAILEWPFDYMKGESGLSGRFEGGAINVDAQFHGRGLVFRRNRIQNLFDGVHLTPWTLNDARTNEIDFYENTVEDCIDDFVEAVSGRLKPASEGRFKTSHYES
jgi:hypothetical protein